VKAKAGNVVDAEILAEEAHAARGAMDRARKAVVPVDLVAVEARAVLVDLAVPRAARVVRGAKVGPEVRPVVEIAAVVLAAAARGVDQVDLVTIVPRSNYPNSK
jgi:hypothetical protein